jgi:hypothetical protein
MACALRASAPLALVVKPLKFIGMAQNQIQPYLTHLHESHRYTSALLYLLLARAACFHKMTGFGLLGMHAPVRHAMPRAQNF